jgi:hypothetical protein
MIMLMFLKRECLSDRFGNVCRRQGRGRDVIRQRLKEVVIAAVNDRNAGPWDIAEFDRTSQAAETAADDDDMARDTLLSLKTRPVVIQSHFELRRLLPECRLSDDASCR